MIDRQWIGHEMPPSVFPIERTRVKFFAKATHQRDPVYSQESAARDAGYADVVAPPTYLFGAQLDSGVLFAMFEKLGIPLQKILHGEQSFEYFAPVVVGDTVTVTMRVKDIYDKRGGALQFVVTESLATNQHGAQVARLESVTVVRQ
jgi:acyl dehydratase